MALAETIYPGDADNASLDFKLVKIARDFRSEQLLSMRKEIELRMLGFHKLEMEAGGGEGARLDRQRVLAQMADIADRLKALHVPPAAIYHGGVAGSSTKAGQIELYSGPKLDLRLPLSPLLPIPSPGNGPGGGQGGSDGKGGTKPNLPYSEGSLVVDPKERTVSTEVQITYDLPGKPATIKNVSVTFSINEKGELSDVAGALKALSATIVKEAAGGVISNVQVSVKAEIVYKTEKEKIATKLKGVLSAELNIPGTRITFELEVAPYVTPSGDKGVSAGITIFKW